MRYMKWFTPFLVLISSILILTACGEIAEKPTGLEDVQGEQTTESVEDSSNNEDEIKEKTNDKKKENNTDDEVNTDEKHSDASSGDEKDQSNSTSTSDNKGTSSEKEKSHNQETSVTNDVSEKKTNEGKDSSTDKKSSNKESKSSESKEKDTNKNKDKNKKSASDTNSSKPEKEEKSTIVYSIVISSDEVPLPPTEMEIEDGDTVLDALIDITMKKSVHMDYRGGQGATAYVQGMGNVYEFDRGPGSGWMYRVNGIFPDRGAGVVPLMDGDRVEWLYTTNLGEDLNADLKPFRR